MLGKQLGHSLKQHQSGLQIFALINIIIQSRNITMSKLCFLIREWQIYLASPDALEVMFFSDWMTLLSISIGFTDVTLVSKDTYGDDEDEIFIRTFVCINFDQFCWCEYIGIFLHIKMMIQIYSDIRSCQFSGHKYILTMFFIDFSGYQIMFMDMLLITMIKMPFGLLSDGNHDRYWWNPVKVFH